MRIPYGLIVELDTKGNILRSFHDPKGQVLPAVSHVDDQGTYIYLGSFMTNYVAKLDLKNVWNFWEINFFLFSNLKLFITNWTGFDHAGTGAAFANELGLDPGVTNTKVY